ncbi:hypothetical protein P9112_001839 [Eukaryota sp. TZLM1-RC]
MTTDLPESVSDWSCEDVQKWLTSIGEGLWADNLRTVTGHHLLTFTNETLRLRYNIHSSGARSNIMMHIHQFRDQHISSAIDNRRFSMPVPHRTEEYTFGPTVGADLEDEVTASHRERLLSLPKRNSRNGSVNSISSTFSRSLSLNSDGPLSCSSPRTISSDEVPSLPLLEPPATPQWLTGTVVWVHAKLGYGLIEPSPQSKVFITPNSDDDILVAFSTVNHSWAHTIGSGSKADPKPDSISVIGTIVRFTLSPNQHHVHSAGKVEVKEQSRQLQYVYESGKTNVGFVYKSEQSFCFIKTLGLEVYVTKDRTQLPVRDFGVGDVVLFESMWFFEKPQAKNVRVVDHHMNKAIKATIISVIPQDKTGFIALAVCEGDGCLRAKCLGFDIGSDVVIIRMGVLNSNVNEADLVGKRCQVELMAHVSGFWHATSCVLNDGGDVMQLEDRLRTFSVAQGTRLRGTVTKIIQDSRKSYGFIVPNGITLNNEVYFHEGRVCPTSRDVVGGATVEFILIYTDTGKPQAQNVKVI